LPAKNFGVHSNDQDIFIIGPVEDANPTALWQVATGAPQKIVLQLDGARMFETEDLTALRIDPRHYVPDGAVLASGIHCLKNNQDSIMV
jgi:hypothetical protein